MDKFALIGFPAKGSLSPVLFEAAYAGAYSYGFIEEEDFAVALKRFMDDSDMRAVNVTAPHKLSAAKAADWRSPEVEKIGAANILVKTGSGLKAYNSDFLGVRQLIRTRAPKARTAIVVGFGGAGKAAYEAALSCGLDCSVRRHNELEEGISADLIIFTLPKSVSGMEKMRCSCLLEANYRTPQCRELKGIGEYISGKEWLKAQALTGYELMTEKKPDPEGLASVEI